MGIKDFRGISLNVFVMMLVTTIFFYLYNLINPFDFPGLWQRLLFFDVGFGVLSFILYFSEIVSVLGKIKIKRPRTRKFRYKIEHTELKTKKYQPKVPKSNFKNIIEVFRTLKFKNIKFKIKRYRSRIPRLDFKKIINVLNSCKNSFVNSTP